MNLGLFLSIGESLSDISSKGQLARLINYNVKYYLQKFNKVYIFTYQDEGIKLPKNCFLIANKSKLHRYIYSLLLPIIHKEEIKQCDVLRGLQITGGIPCFVAKLFYNKPYIINYGYDYSNFARIEKKYLQSLLFKAITPFVINFADTVIITAPFLNTQIKKYKQKNVYLIPNGVNIQKFAPKKRENNPITKLIFVGRLEPQKNLINLLEALKGIDVEMLMVGSGSLKKQILNFASKNKINLKIIDSIPHNRLPKILNNSDIFVMPSLKEGNPKALLEAMSVGLPCIGSRVEGIRELINHNQNGIVTETSSGSIRNGVLKLIGDKYLQKRLGQNARKFVINNFDSGSLLKKETNLLLKLTK